METIIATICNTKGGVGKTTITANIAGILSEIGLKVLLVDADNQPALSSYFDIERRDHENGLTSLVKISNPEDFLLSDFAHQVKDISNIDIVLSDDPSGSLKNWLMKEPVRPLLNLRKNLRSIQHEYDVILIDSHGGSDFQQMAAALAADMLISPAETTLMAARELGRGIVEMIEQLTPLALAASTSLGTVHMVINMISNTNDSKEFCEHFHSETFAKSHGSIKVIDSAISRLSVYAEAPRYKLPVHKCGDKKSRIRTTTEMAMVVAELFPVLKKECLALIKETK